MRSPVRRGLFLAIFSAMAPISASAIDTPFSCPSEIPSKSIRIIDQPEGWTGFTPGPLRLSHAGFMQAEPSHREELAPSTISEGKTRDILTWKIEGKYTDGIWLSCQYAGGLVSLSRKIGEAESFSECSVTYWHDKKATPHIESIRCRK